MPFFLWHLAPRFYPTKRAFTQVCWKLRLSGKLSSLQYLAASISHLDAQKEASSAVISSVILLGPGFNLYYPLGDGKAYTLSKTAYKTMCCANL